MGLGFYGPNAAFLLGTVTAELLEEKRRRKEPFFNTVLTTHLRRFAMSEQGKQIAKMAAMIAGGAVVGAGIGLLFAPQTGAETRRDIARYARKAQVRATRWGRAVRSGVKDVVDRSRHLVRPRDTKPVIEAA
jgi:hypothetical protein